MAQDMPFTLVGSLLNPLAEAIKGLLHFVGDASNKLCEWHSRVLTHVTQLVGTTDMCSGSARVPQLFERSH